MDKNILIDALAELVGERMNKGVGYKHDLSTGFSLSTNLMHGPAGIFGTAGAEQDVFSTRVVPRGMLSVLPAQGTVDTNPITYYLTGFTDETGDEPSAACADCVKAGEIKSIRQGTVFGLVCRESDELNVSEIGARVNRGEMFDLRLVNDPLLNTGALWVPDSVPTSVQQVLNREVLARWLTLGAAFERKLGDLVWTGNPVNNVGDGYAEYFGFESLVRTGHVDVINGTAAPSLDSDIKDANYVSVETNPDEVFRILTALYRYVRHNAETMGFLPVEWVWVMKDSLFRQLADVWPLTYAGYRGDVAKNLSNNVDAMVMRNMADAMYNGRYLQIDGVNIPVILDDFIPYETSQTNQELTPGSFASDIYLIPMNVRGGVPVTYMEYFDYSASNGVMQAIADGRLTNDYWTDGGRFLWTTSRTKWCVNWSAKIKPRLRLRTPHLAGRVENVVFAPLQMFREPFGPYHVNGGNTSANNAPYDIYDFS